MATIKVTCHHCNSTDDVVKNGKVRSGVQRFLGRLCGKSFQLDCLYNANQSGMHEKIVQLTRNGSGVRDVERVLAISRTTVIAHLKNSRHRKSPSYLLIKP